MAENELSRRKTLALSRPLPKISRTNSPAELGFPLRMVIGCMVERNHCLILIRHMNG